MNTTDTITRQLVADEQRLNTTAELFGINFPMQLEPAIFSFAGNLSEDYSGATGSSIALPTTVSTWRSMMTTSIRSPARTDSRGGYRQTH